MWQQKRFRGDKARAAIFNEDGMRCAYCLVDFHTLPRKSRTLDHVIPRVMGGTNVPTNFLSACLSCNSRRQDMDIRDFVGIETLVRLIRDYPRTASTIVATLSTSDWLHVTKRTASR